jgi:methionyl-tRNA formyltransferase
MRIVFAGTPLNAAYTLETLISKGFDVVGVLTREDALVGRKKVLTETPVATVASRNGLEIIKANSVSSEVLTWLNNTQAEIGVIVAYGSILKKSALEAPAKGWINLHYSLLPEYPGAAPVQHAIMDGAASTGVTVFRLDEGVDSGPILAASQVEIQQHVTAGELLSELTLVGADLLVSTLNDLDALIANQKLQSRSEKAKMASKLSRSDAKLDFSLSADQVHNFVRAMNPEPVAWFEFGNLSIRVLKTAVAASSQLSIGEFELSPDGLLVGCSAGSVELVVVQPAGKNEMPGADWFRGLKSDGARIS